MLRLNFSNRYELLQEKLLDRLEGEGGDPFAPWQIIVPSAAIRRQIDLSCADRLGIAANIELSYLAEWLWRQIGRMVDIPEVSPFAPASLSWRIFEIFGDVEFVDTQPRLQHYLKQADAVMRLELATRVAQLLEHYITYRPKWLAAWSAGKSSGLPGSSEDETWQAALWRRITVELGIRHYHPATLFFQKIQELGDTAPQRVGLPRTAHIFCLPAMPPLYLEILRRLSQWMEIEIYALNPCREYWFEIVDQKRLGYLAIQQKDLFHEVGNALLASWGKQTQAHIDLLFSDDGQIIEEDSHFEPSAAKSLLAALQNTILDLEELAPGSYELAEGDHSIEIHVCHSLTRELEVLQDQLLGFFVEDKNLKPSDILVLTPDLEAAAPLIDAVFGTVPESRRIPYQITGRAETRINPVAAVFDRLLKLCDSRFAASSVFDLLQQAPVAERFGLTVDDLERIHDWINETGIRWGLDASHRQTLGLPKEERHTLTDGLNRLYLAYALGNSEQAHHTVIAGSIGAGNPEGSTAMALGAFWAYVRNLEWMQHEWSRPRDASGWQSLLNEMLERFISPSNHWLDELNVVRSAIAELHRNMTQGRVQAPVDGEVIRAALMTLLDDPVRGAVPTGSVTFSVLSGLRGLPYKIICLIGMNDGAFPSNQRPAEFDLMMRFPQRGDRQRRFDERNLFLDLLLAARQRFYLSYSGRSIRDDSIRPPSVLLAELLDTLSVATASDPADPESLKVARHRFQVEHPLQAFAALYFAGDAMEERKSFHQEYCRALSASFLQKNERSTLPLYFDEDDEADDSTPERGNQRLFFGERLSAPEQEWRTVDLDQLIRFYRHPGRALLQRIGVRLPKNPENWQDDEPFLSDWNGRRLLAERLLPTLLMQNDEQTRCLDKKECSNFDLALVLAKAGNEFPTGVLGERLLTREVEDCSRFAAELAPFLAVPCFAPIPFVFELDIEDECWQLTGVIQDARPEGLVRYRYDETRAADYLSGWIEHLFLCAAAPQGVAAKTIWYSRDEGYALKPMDTKAAQEQLDILIRLYRTGLMAPLHFFPKSAWAYVSEGNRLDKARAKWCDFSGHGYGEGDDATWRLVLRGVANPLDAEFENLAQLIFGSLMAHLDRTG